MNTTFILWTGVVCPTPPQVSNAYMFGTGNHYGDNITYTCQEVGGAALRFEDGYTEKTITCTDAGQWSENNFTCGGMTGHCLYN